MWVTVDGHRMVWWLCESHMEELKKAGSTARFLKNVGGVMTHPQIQD